jgi:phosphoribosylanthranilate isomerase
MAPFIKVCGIQSVDEARGVLACGANTIGLLVGTTYRAEDAVTPSMAREITAAIGASARTVMVTHWLDVERITATVRRIGVSAVQIQNELSVAGLALIRDALPDVELIKAIHVQDESSLDRALVYVGCADYVLLDTRTRDRLGGTGLTHDWRISRMIVKAVDLPVVLAGGLHPGNVAAAIDIVQPAGIDANSGLEEPDGQKDFRKVRLFAAAGRACRPRGFR